MNIKKYDHGHSCGARSADRMIAVVCARPTNAHNLVPRPTSRNPPSDASTSSTPQAKIRKLGSTTWSTSHEYGWNTGYWTAKPVHSRKPPKSGGTFQPAPPSHRNPRAIRTAASSAPSNRDAGRASSAGIDEDPSTSRSNADHPPGGSTGKLMKLET